MSFQARVQSVERWVLRQDIQISVQIRERQATYNRSQPEKFITPFRMRRQESFNLFFLYTPRVHVLSRHDRIDRQERFAFVFKRRGDWSLEQTIKESQILGGWVRSAALVELKQIAIRRKRLLVSLVFVDTLKDFSYFQQFRDRAAFAGA